MDQCPNGALRSAVKEMQALIAELGQHVTAARAAADSNNNQALQYALTQIEVVASLLEAASFSCNEDEVAVNNPTPPQ
jgi:hypothetical protein